MRYTQIIDSKSYETFSFFIKNEQTTAFKNDEIHELCATHTHTRKDLLSMSSYDVCDLTQFKLFSI